MSIDPVGSYAFDSLVNRQEEFERLLKQATVLPELELDVLKQHGLKAGINILDAACGPGALSCLIGKNIEQVKITGIDINSSLLEEAKKLALQQNLDIDFHQADIYNLSYQEQFGFIYSRFLFQHLQAPEKALNSLYSALQPNGRICLMDVDDGWLNLYPDIPAFKHICQKALDFQSRQGGDRLVGRKLRSYLKAAGFTNIKTNVVAVNSDQIGIEEFIRITTGFKKEAFKESGEDGERHLREIWQSIEESDVFGIVGVFVVSGEKKC